MAASLTDEQIERLHLEYAQCGSFREVARILNVAPSTIKRHIDNDRRQPAREALQAIRTQNKVDIAAKIAEVQLVILEALKSPEKISKASYQELSTSYGILTDKHQLITGQATERHEHRDLDEPRTDLARRIDELAERRRAKHADPRTQAVGS